MARPLWVPAILCLPTRLVRVENPKGRVTTVENAPIDPETWQVAQSGGKDRVITALDHGMKIDFTGASSRNPYIKISKAVQMWGIPDTLRLRLVPGDMQIKLVKMLVETAYGERVTVEYPVETSEGEITIDAPVSDVCDAADLGNFPLHLVYYYITYNAVTTGGQYSLGIPGMELVYDSMPADEVLVGDVNGDGEISIADVNVIIQAILTDVFLPAADVNHDNEITVADINTVIRIILA